MTGPLARVEVRCPRCGKTALADMYMESSVVDGRNIRLTEDLIVLDHEDCAEEET